MYSKYNIVINDRHKLLLDRNIRFFCDYIILYNHIVRNILQEKPLGGISFLFYFFRNDPNTICVLPGSILLRYLYLLPVTYTLVLLYTRVGRPHPQQQCTRIIFDSYNIILPTSTNTSTYTSSNNSSNTHTHTDGKTNIIIIIIICYISYFV